MKKHLQILIFICLLNFEGAFSQDNIDDKSKTCENKISQYVKFSKDNDFEKAYLTWLWCFENCPKTSLRLYTYGLKIAKNRYETGDKAAAGKLIDKIYAQRIQNHPKNLGKTYSDWATSLEKRGATKDHVFEKLEAAFKADPTGMSVKNISKFFQEVTVINKDKNLQKVFDIYDDLIEATNTKIDILTRELDKINAKEKTAVELTSKEKRTQRNNTINLRALSQVGVLLDYIINPVFDSNCEKLVPLYQKGFEAHKADTKWLRRAVSILFTKECTDNSLYPKILEAYANSDRSISTSIYLRPYHTDIHNYDLELTKLINLETDPYKKAEYLYKMARTMNKASAVKYARKALKHRPSMGKAYLLIARMYARSANSCGTDEISKRMVYVAAADKARKAKEVDPSITAKANKYIKTYTALFPSKKILCTIPKGEFQIKCWIGETVIIP